MNSFAATLSRFFTRRASKYVALLLLLMAVSMLSVAPIWAESDSLSSLSVSSLTIMPSSGQVMYTDPWTATAFAQAQNSFGGFDQQFNSDINQVTAHALVQFATGRALADPINLVLSSGAKVNIPVEPIGFVAASAQGTADIFNSTFMITGGTGQVNVTFNAMLNYGQDYTLLLEADAESSGQSMPEPSTMSLLFGGPALALARRWIMSKRA